MTDSAATGAGRPLQERPAGSGKDGFSFQRFVLTWGGLFIVWMMLVASFDAVEIATGIVVAGFVAALSVGHLALLDDIILTPLLPFHLARYFLLFFRELIRANLDVAARVVAPSVDITPEIVEVHTELHSDLGKLWLANSITLTPGTLTIDIEDQTLKVHWIDVSAGTDTAVATREIAARFEAALKEFLK